MFRCLLVIKRKLAFINSIFGFLKKQNVKEEEGS